MFFVFYSPIDVNYYINCNFKFLAQRFNYAVLDKDATG